MKSKRILSVILSMVLVGSTTMIGCGGGKSNSSNNSTKDAGGPDKKQYLNVVGAEPKSLDACKASDTYSSQILNDLEEGLTRLELEGDKEVQKPAGAESWDISKDGLEWTFHLRDNKWNDGKPVTAKDYEYSVKRTIDPKTGSTYAFLLYPIKNAEKCNSNKASLDEVGIKAVDDKTLKITLEKPTAYFLQLTSFKVMLPQRQDIVEKHGDQYGTDPDKLVYCGPFVLDKWTHQNKIEFKKNDQYWDAQKVKLDKLTMKIMKQEASRMGELQTGALDMAGVYTPKYVDKFTQSGKFNITRAYDGSTTYEFFNQKNKYFKNLKIRKAFALAADREGVCKTLFKGLAEPATAFCSPQIQVGDEEYRKIATNEPVTKLKEENPDAKKLLIEGLKEIGEDPDPAKMKITYLAGGTGASQKEFCEFDQEAYKKVLGVNIKIEYVEWPIFSQRTDDMDYEMAGMGWTGDFNDPMTFFDIWTSKAGVNRTGWGNKEYDDLIAKASNTMDNKERAKYFKEAENILLYKECVLSTKVYRKRQTFIRKYVKNVMIPLFGPTEFKYVYTEGRDK